MGTMRATPARLLRLWVPLLVVVVLLLVGCLYATLGSAAPFVPTAVVLPTKQGNTKVTLRVRTGRVSIPLEWSDGKEVFFEYTGRFYEEGNSGPMLPGPTLKVNPGGKIVLTLVNELGAEGLENMTGLMNRFHGPNITNMHFHGMHSDPRKDNPFIVARPGETLVYKISVPRDHEPGLHWYHTHSHGAVYFQLMGGLFGAIDVGEGDFMTTPVHPFRGWDSQVLMVHLYRLQSSGRCDGLPMSSLDDAMGTLLPSNPRIVDRKGNEYDMPADLFLVNGQHRPTVTVRRGHPMLLRIAFASGTCYMNVSLPQQCAFHLTAVDGTQLGRTVEVVQRWQYFTTATRRGLVVVCNEEGTYPVHHVGDHADIIFYIKSEGGGKKAAAEVAFPVTMPKYSPDYLHLKGRNVLHREISFSQRDLPTPKPYYVVGQGTDCQSLQNSSTCLYEHFQGEISTRIAGYHGFTVPLHTVVTARVFGDPTDARPHPLHFHVNHFQFLSFEPRAGGKHENQTMDMYGVFKGEFYDTIPILDGVTTIRWQAATYVGEVVYHCHAVHHEDRGMMSSYLVYSPRDEYGKAVQRYEASQRSGSSSAWLHRSQLYILLFVLLLASAAAGVWRYLRQRGIRSVADVQRVFDARADAGTSGEHIPLVERDVQVLSGDGVGSEAPPLSPPPSVRPAPV
ncbi:Multicopper oxidase [Novymonas esmeraldas]|uniref:Multicopper oxidase n=1 Tax=Novymonas esmeraldas TaxID=1808958 RepID=A0AAW0EVS7_9TRYP